MSQSLFWEVAGTVEVEPGPEIEVELGTDYEWMCWYTYLHCWSLRTRQDLPRISVHD